MEILSLEDSIRELHDMFYDLAQIVYDQDDLINQIQFNVDSAAVFVEHGTRVVNTASAYRRSSTRIKWIICIIVTVVTVIVVVVAVLLVGGIVVSLVTRQINNI
jgi:t-SNARE complex subunit (syntaxin)